jgi:hypothetical protein
MSKANLRRGMPLESLIIYLEKRYIMERILSYGRKSSEE